MIEDRYLLPITDLMKLKSFKKEDEIYQVDERSSHLYIVIRGKVDLYKKNTEGISNW